MLTRRTCSALSSSERQLLRAQRLQSGQCARCFHASIQHQAEKQATTKSHDNGTPHNAPPRRPTRRQRAARISNEVSMLQKGPPPGDPTTGPGSVSGTYQSDPPPPTTSAGFTSTPHSMGGERMGENVSAGREGPNAQGVGRLTSSDERTQNEHPMARSTRTPDDAQEPAEGSPSVLEATRPGPSLRTVSPGSQWSASDERALRERLAAVKPLGVPFRPRQPRAVDLLQSGSSAATPIANQFESVVLDRLKTATSPSTPLLGRSTGPHLSKRTTRKVVRALVAGRDESYGRLASQEQTKQPLLHEVAQLLRANGTYLAEDGKRVLKKIHSLLPAAAVTRPPQEKME